MLFMSEENKSINEQATKLKALYELERVVDFTRRARMEASDRLISSERFIQNINIYYSCFAVIVSILCLVYESKVLSVFSAILTAILAISIVFLNAQHYGERAQQFHENFLELYQLLFKIRTDIRNEIVSNIPIYEEQYIKLLKSIENHTQQDFLQVLSVKDHSKLRRDQNYKRQFTGLPKVYYEVRKIIAFIIKMIVWLFPLFCLWGAWYFRQHV